VNKLVGSFLGVFGIAVIATGVTGCAKVLPPSVLDDNRENAKLVEGPPMERIVTPFDAALACVKGKISPDFAFSVGAVADNTGKEQYADGGSGKYISQGAGDMVQSALFAAGLTVVNRRDPNIVLAESNWGLRPVGQQIPSDFFITGSITSLDFIPGGGGRVEVAGVGPRYRQSRILIGLDLALTAAHSGKIVGNAAVQKQLYAEELGFSANRFLGEALVAIDIGAMEREAVHLALRQALSFATLSLLVQVMPGTAANECAAQIPSNALVAAPTDLIALAGDGTELAAAKAAASKIRAAASPAAAPSAQGTALPADAQPGQGNSSAPGAKSPPEAVKLANAATSYSARSIAAADSVLQSKTKADAIAAANEAAQYMTLAIQSLREAAAKGLTGAEGDATATLVENAIRATEAAHKYIEGAKFPDDAEAPTLPAPSATPEPGPDPANPNDKKLGGSN
jgi:curli biogenesis system outer membrane secretion channel CsgG